MYTEKQMEMLERLENGLVWVWHIHLEEDGILHFLAEEKLCAAREDISPGYMILTEKGRTVLTGTREQAAKEAEQKAEKERAESKRLEERRQDQSDAERRYRTQNKIAVIMPLVTFVLGMLTEHFWGLAAAVISFFQ